MQPRKTVPLPHFRSKTRDLPTGARLALEVGDVSMIAREVGRSVSHVHRVIGRERPSPALEGEIEAVVGWPIRLIDLPRAKRTAA